MGIFTKLKTRRKHNRYSPPAPTFRAGRRRRPIMQPLWNGKITPAEARQMATNWQFPENQIEEIIAKATAEPSFWWHHEKMMNEKPN